MATAASTAKKKSTSGGISTTDLPKKIIVGPFTFAVERVPDLLETCKASEGEDIEILFGRIDWRRQAILLEANMEPETLRETLLHEICHLIWHVVGGLDEEKLEEERVVRMISPTLLDTFDRNPALVAYLFGAK